MSSILNMLHSVEDDGLNLVVLVPLFAVIVVAITLLLKFSFRKPEVTKKPLNSAKKQQKLQTANNNKQKEEKVNSEKREKVPKDKKLSSPNKFLDKQADNEAIKAGKKQQNAVVDEKSSKKNSAQTKKQQVNNKTKNNQISSNSNKKQQIVDIFINKEEEGEWQMVTTKKQKQTKQEEKVESATTPTKAKTKLQKSPEMTKKQQNTKDKKAKEVTEKSDDSTKFVISETPKDIQTLQEGLENTDANDFPASLATPNFDSSLNNAQNILVNKNEAVTVEKATPIANVAFDELGDDGWTDTKPQKKNRKRALRE